MAKQQLGGGVWFGGEPTGGGQVQSAGWLPELTWVYDWGNFIFCPTLHWDYTICPPLHWAFFFAPLYFANLLFAL
jgi:hypothetical protein